MLVDQGRQGEFGKGAAAGQHFVKHNAKGVDVALRPNFAAADLFRRKVGWRADNIALGDAGLGADFHSDAKIAKIGVAIFIQQDVVGLDVPMYDAIAMSEGQSRADLLQDLAGRFRVQDAMLVNAVAQTAAAQIAHHQKRAVRLAPIVIQRHNMRMLQTSDNLSLAFKAADEFRRIGVFGQNDLDGHLAQNSALAGAVDNAIAPLTQKSLDIVRLNSCAS